MSAYFISGASSGLGAEMARQLGARGETVALAARRVERLDSTAAEIRDRGGSAKVYELDVTDVVAVDDVIRRADGELGGLDVVVVNAGRGGGRSIGKGGAQQNRALIETNLIGALAQAETATSLFRERGNGHLVLVSSMAAMRGLPRSAAVYSATKIALASIGESLRTEFQGTGIKITTLRPGYISTAINEDSRFPFKTSLEKGAAAMIRAIDAEVSDVVVPMWPWRPLGWIMRIAPSRLLRRLM